MAQFTFTINGAKKTVDVPSDMPLLWILRDLVGLTGAKYGCGVGSCGACTVLLGDEAVKSCLISADEVEGKPITTIEGLSADGSHPLQKAWIETDVPQCGYCQTGQIMAAAALLKAHPKPSDTDVDDYLSTNICRCGTYPRIREAIPRAVAEEVEER